MLLISEIFVSRSFTIIYFVMVQIKNLVHGMERINKLIIIDEITLKYLIKSEAWAFIYLINLL